MKEEDMLLAMRRMRDEIGGLLTRVAKLEAALTGSKERTNGAKGKRAYGTYKNVYLTREEYAAFIEEEEDAQRVIERMSEYCSAHGRSYYNALATLRQFAREDEQRRSFGGKRVAARAYEQRQYNESEFEGLYVDLTAYGRETDGGKCGCAGGAQRVD